MDKFHIGFMLAFKRRRDGNQKRIGLYRLRGGAQKAVFHRGLDHLTQFWLDNMNFSPVDGLDRTGVNVDAHHVFLARRKSRGRRQTDISQSDY